MSSRLQYSLEIGTIVECIHNDKILIAVIQDIRASSLYLYTNTNREIKINENRILPWIGSLCPKNLSRNEYATILQQALFEREAIKASLDIHELWKCIAGELSKTTVEELASLLTENSTPDFLAGLGRALLEHNDYFKFVSPYFEVYSEEQYRARKAQQEAQIQRQILIDSLKTLLSHIVESIQKNIPLAIESLSIADEYKTYFRELIVQKLQYSCTPEQENIWKEITTGVQEQERSLPIILGQALHIIPKHYNIFAHSVGYSLEESWEIPYREEINRLSHVEHSHPFIDIPFISIDSETTKDIDDAFYLESLTDGLYKVHFAIALPVEYWDYKSELHKEVVTRATSLYLPEGTYNMLPSHLAEDVYSIRANEKKNILYIAIDINPVGEIISTHISIATAIITENTTYKQCESLLNSQSPTWLHQAYRLAKELQEKRLNNGGIFIKREEHDIILHEQGDDYEIDIKKGESYPQSQLLVSEFMILANTAIVQFAKENAIPLIHRVQECSTPTGSQRVWERPEEIHSIMKMLTSVSLNVLPKRHAALGILGYATITSPLRRLVDFINEEQIYSWCIHGVARYSEDALSATIPLIQRNTEQSLSIQRFRTRYWKLCFLKQHEHDWFTGIFVEDNNFIYIYLPLLQLTVKAKPSLCGNKCILGESVEVRCIANPLQNDITVVELR